MRPFPLHLALTAASLCLVAACHANSPVSSVVVETDCRLRQQLEAATLDADPIVRRAAVRVLGNRGPGTSVDVVGELVSDPDESVGMAAIEALIEMNMRGGDFRARAAGHLARAVRGGTPRIRYFALHALGSCGEAAAGQLDTIRACFQDEPPDTQITAAIAWAKIARSDEVEAQAVELIKAHSGGPFDRSLSMLLDYLGNATSAGVLEKLLTSYEPSVRFRAECTRARLEGGQDPLIGKGELEASWHTENSAAQDALMDAAWKPVPRSEVLVHVGKSRLVLCGEMHASEGPIRENQREVLRAFVKRPAFEAVGYEPSVEDVQKSVLDLARALGLRTIPLETSWSEFTSQDRPGARELEALDAIGNFLRADPSNRMLVLRGESHVLPGGYLSRRLPVKPVMVLSGCTVNVPLCLGGLRCDGTSYQVGTTGDVFALPYDDPSIARDTAALERWLSAH